jgi:type I restriction enzyme R subunit
LAPSKGKNITDDEQVPGIDTKEAFENAERLKMIVQHIMLNHNQLTANRQYNAIFTVSSTEMALKYYHMFKQLDINHQLNVTTIFTWKANEDDAEEKQDRMKSPHAMD